MWEFQDVLNQVCPANFAWPCHRRWHHSLPLAHAALAGAASAPFRCRPHHTCPYPFPGAGPGHPAGDGRWSPVSVAHPRLPPGICAWRCAASLIRLGAHQLPATPPLLPGDPAVPTHVLVSSFHSTPRMHAPRPWHAQDDMRIFNVFLFKFTLPASVILGLGLKTDLYSE